MTCNRCSDSVKGSVTEILAWDKEHNEFCPMEEES